MAWFNNVSLFWAKKNYSIWSKATLLQNFFGSTRFTNDLIVLRYGDPVVQALDWQSHVVSVRGFESHLFRLVFKNTLTEIGTDKTDVYLS